MTGALFALTASVAATASDGGATTADGAPKEINAVLAEQVAAWNAGDLEKFCAPYSADAAFATPTGVVIGRAAILERYRSKYTTAEKRGTLSLEPIAFTRIGPDAWALIGKWTLRFKNKKKPATGTTALVFRRALEGRWEIAQDASF